MGNPFFYRELYRFFTELLPKEKENADGFGIFGYLVGMAGIVGDFSRLFDWRCFSLKSQGLSAIFGLFAF